jgi:crossover junction endodeoxyribonuclease RusA
MSDPRSWTVELPPGMDLLNSNDRDGHWARRKRITEALRAAAGWAARQQKIPPLERAAIVAVYEPPDRRRRDPQNWQPSFKACVDGLVDARVLPDDDSRHLDGPDPRLGEVCKGGRIVLHITEVPS